jgi:hypothetical protein
MTGHDGNDHDLDTSIMLNPISAPFIIHLPSGNDYSNIAIENGPVEIVDVHGFSH